MKSLSQLSDNELVASFRDVIIESQERLVLELDHFIELDRRKLFASHSSLWAYVVHEYGMEERTAERKIWAARMLKRFPELRRLLESGKMNLSLLEIIQGAVHREKPKDLEVSKLLSELSGLSCRAARRELAVRYPQSTELPRDSIRPLNEKNSKIRFIADEELLEMLERARGILAHSHPKGTIGEIFNHVLQDYLKRNDPEERAKRAEVREVQQAQKPTPLLKTPPAPGVISSPWTPKATAHVSLPSAPKVPPRFASQALTHAIIRRDAYRCAYVDPQTGKKCLSIYGLQKDHVQSWSKDGKTELRNLRYLCQGHHRRVSFLEFGESEKYFSHKRE
jgi:5-methylcytosine-specific restriction endonuclease McrA